MESKLLSGAALAAAVLLSGALATGASAHVGGYGDGAPGPADTWAATHPNFGKVTHGQKASGFQHKSKRLQSPAAKRPSAKY